MELLNICAFYIMYFNKTHIFLLTVTVGNVSPVNTKNMTTPTCDKEYGTFATSINQYLKSLATKLHNLCSTIFSKEKCLDFIFWRKWVCGGAGLFEFFKYSTVILHKLS